MSSEISPELDSGINLNQQVYFRLSDHGRNILRDKFIAETDLLIDVGSRIRGSIIESQKQQTDAVGITSMSLWEFAQTFGPHLHMGAEVVVEKNTISLTSPSS